MEFMRKKMIIPMNSYNYVAMIRVKHVMLGVKLCWEVIR